MAVNSDGRPAATGSLGPFKTLCSGPMRTNSCRAARNNIRLSGDRTPARMGEGSPLPRCALEARHFSDRIAIDMKPFRPPAPDPPPPVDLWKAGMALTMLIVGSGLGLAGFSGAGAISPEQFLIVLVFIASVCLGVFIGMGMEFRARRRSHGHEEVTPPPDFMKHWPIEDARESDRDGGAAKD